MRREIVIAAAVLVGFHQPGRAAVDHLRQQAEVFAGRAVELDSRLAVPDCAGGYLLGWANAAQTAIAASCGRMAWRMVLPVAAVAPIRRGQPLRVETAGQGFRLGVDVVAEGRSGAGGRIAVRNSRSGRAFEAVAAEDGRMILPESR